MDKALGILKQYYGYSSFREGQEEIIREILNGNDVLTIMPTGGGKSICYQVPAILLDGITIVISPLISLMKDQVDNINNLGIKSAYINSSLSNIEINNILDEAAKNEIKILYVAPERLESQAFIELIASINVSMIAIDEAHCVSQWGHDFRSSYRRISRVISLLRNRPIVTAFTATATDEVRKDIVNLLKLNNPKVFISGFDTYVEELVIKCDPESLERVILNLLSNAVKFSNENGNITVLLDANKDFVIIKVKDDGIGIAPEVSDYVFERFAQEDKSFNRKKEGSGIGLSLVKSLVELHGGVVYLEKSVEQGCEFVIKLPNKILDESKNEEIKSIDIDNKPLIQKVNIEFSDIYELY